VRHDRGTDALPDHAEDCAALLGSWIPATPAPRGITIVGAGGRVVASTNDVSDAEILPDLLEDVPVEIEQISADGIRG